MQARSTIGALAILLVIGAAGCGRETVRGSPSDGKIAVEVYEYGFRPNLIEARPGRTTIVLQNSGALAHNFTIERWGRRLAKTRTALAGTKSVTVDLTPGVYSFRCTVPHHDDLGETGKIVVAD